MSRRCSKLGGDVAPGFGALSNSMRGYWAVPAVMVFLGAGGGGAMDDAGGNAHGGRAAAGTE
jgi:hypothetical protein